MSGAPGPLADDVREFKAIVEELRNVRQMADELADGRDREDTRGSASRARRQLRLTASPSRSRREEEPRRRGRNSTSDDELSAGELSEMLNPSEIAAAAAANGAAEGMRSSSRDVAEMRQQLRVLQQSLHQKELQLLDKDSEARRSALAALEKEEELKRGVREFKTLLGSDAGTPAPAASSAAAAAALPVGGPSPGSEAGALRDLLRAAAEERERQARAMKEMERRAKKLAKRVELSDRIIEQQDILIKRTRAAASAAPPPGPAPAPGHHHHQHHAAPAQQQQHRRPSGSAAGSPSKGAGFGTAARFGASASPARARPTSAPAPAPAPAPAHQAAAPAEPHVAEEEVQRLLDLVRTQQTTLRKFQEHDRELAAEAEELRRQAKAERARADRLEAEKR
eukprot:tig00000073_g1681.t1